MVKEVGWIPSEVVPPDHLVSISHLKDINDEFDQITDQITDRVKRNDQEPKAVSVVSSTYCRTSRIA